ncbi:hypothetical protein AMATHDRAFT_138224, partial [Amanita thiersii Skay4041]
MFSGSQNVTVEHWVEVLLQIQVSITSLNLTKLDPLKSPSPTLGEEQILDIELDKRTIIKQPEQEYTSISSKVLWDLSPQATNETENQVKDHNSRRLQRKLEYASRLSQLVNNFPLTLKETKNIRSSQYTNLPYTLASTEAEYRMLIIGRRKAIEWGRANALRRAFNEISKLGDREHVARPRLSTADVYIWLTENGYFPRPD